MKRWIPPVLALLLIIIMLPGIIHTICARDTEGWTSASEEAFVKGCTWGDSSYQAKRICECLLDRIKARGVTPTEAADISDRLLAGQDAPYWIEADAVRCGLSP